MTTQTKQPRHKPPTITMNPVKSSNIAATGYDPSSKTFAVQFRGGGRVYHYHDVPESVFGDMGKSESVGKFITGQVVGKFKHTQIAKAD